MKINIMQNEPDDTNGEQKILNVSAGIDGDLNRLHINWDCYRDRDLDLIMVVRTDENITVADLKNTLSNTAGSDKIQVFVYDRNYTLCHTEYLEEKKYNYYVFPGKLDGNEIEIFLQDDNNNVLKANDQSVAQAFSLGISCEITYHWNKFFNRRKTGMAYIKVTKNGILNANVLEYRITGRTEIFKMGLVESSNCMKVPLKMGEKICLLNPHISCTEKNAKPWGRVNR